MLKKIKRNIFLIYYTIRLICKICKAKFILAFILSIINGILPVSSLLVMQQLLNEIQNKTQSYQYVVYLLILYFGLIISESLLQNLASYNLNNLNNHLVYGINYILMKKCGDLSLEMLERTETYDMINRLEQEIGNKPYQTMQGVLGLASNLVSLFSAAMILLSWNPILVIIMIAVSILMFIGQIYVGNKEFLMRYERSGKERKTWYYTYLLTHDTAFKEVKAYGLKKYLLDKYCSLVKTFIKQANEIEKTRAVLNMIISFIQDIVCIIIMIIAIYLAYVGKKMIGTTMSYLNAVSMMQNATNSIASNVYSIYNANLYIQLLKDFLEIKEGENALGGTKVDNIKTIELRNVSFDYPQCKMALSTINLKIKSNEQIAIVGKNGSGKSTLFKILCGLYKPTSGKLFVNNLDLENIDVKSYRNCISVLFQDFLKYEGTLEENVYIGDISTEVDENKIKNSLCKANVDFLKTERGYELKRGLGNWFDEGGQLSGGQWQKIALARTYYKNADLYLLDEPSSALDVTAETKIFKSFFEVSKNKIAIYITHRVKIAQDANKIIVLDGGKIVGIGTHAELLKNCSVYQDLYNQENLKNKG